MPETYASPRVLDPCCGSRMMWFNKAHPDVVFGDTRRETITVTDRSHGREDGTRTLCIEPRERLMSERRKALPPSASIDRLLGAPPSSTP